MREKAGEIERELKTLPAEPDRLPLAAAEQDVTTLESQTSTIDQQMKVVSAKLQVASGTDEDNPWRIALSLFQEFCAHIPPGSIEIARSHKVSAYLTEQGDASLRDLREEVSRWEMAIHDMRNKLQVATMKRDDLGTAYKTALEMHEGATAKIEEQGEEVNELRSQAEDRDILAREKAKLWKAEEELATLQEAAGKVDLDAIRAAHEASHKKLEDLANTIAPIKKKADEAEADCGTIMDESITACNAAENEHIRTPNAEPEKLQGYRRRAGIRKRMHQARIAVLWFDRRTRNQAQEDCTCRG